MKSVLAVVCFLPIVCLLTTCSNTVDLGQIIIDALLPFLAPKD